MTVIVDGKEFATHETRIINGRPILVITMDSAPPVVDGVKHSEFECLTINGVTTLSVPLGEKPPTPTKAPFKFSPQLPEASQPTLPPFEVDFGLMDAMDATLERIIGGLADRVPEKPLAPVINIDEARSRSHHPSRKSRRSGPPRIGFTPRPTS